MGKYSWAPGIRFHPTDEELVMYYLKRKILGKKLSFQGIAEVDIYRHAPWDLPDLSCSKTGDLKWFFFCPTEKKYSRGGRLNRATEYGYWKTTGRDRPVNYNEKVVGMIRTLVFHQGKPPRGDRTDWVMHEYRLEEKDLADRGVVQDTYVLCVVFKKNGMGPRNGAQYGAPFKEEDWSDDEELNFPGTDSFMSTLVTGGASSSYVPESLCAGPSVESNALYALPVVVSAPQVPVADAPLLPVVTDANAVPGDAPQLPLVPRAQESNDDISSMLDMFTEVDLFDLGELPGPDNSLLAGGASSSYVPGSLFAGPSVESNALCALPVAVGTSQVPVADAPLLPVVTDANAVPGDAPQLDISSMLDMFTEVHPFNLGEFAGPDNSLFVAPDELAFFWGGYDSNNILNPFE